MANLNNAFLEGRVVSAAFSNSVTSASASLTSGVYIPTGALVTGVTYMQTGTNATHNSMGSFSLSVGAISLISAQAQSAVPAQTIASRPLLVSSAGMYLSTGGELNMGIGSNLTASTGSIAMNVYVGYVV
jgi:hypothetical protein